MKSIVLAILVTLSVSGVSPCNAAVKPCEVRSTFDNKVMLEDSKGNLWSAEELCAGLEKGDKCLVLFDEKGTETICDDEIIRIFLEEGEKSEVQC